MGRRVRTKLDLLKPDISNTKDKALVKEKLYHDREARPRWFLEGDHVWVQKTNSKSYMYEAGKIVKRQTDYSYLVMIQGNVRRKHTDPLRLKNDTRTSNGDSIETAECECQSQSVSLAAEGRVIQSPTQVN